jgi:hypothetical protein
MRILLVPLVLLGALGCSASPAAKVPSFPAAPQTFDHLELNGVA